MYKLKAATNGLTVTGSAERTIISDRATWTGSFGRQVGANDLKQGSERMGKDLETVLAHFRSKGIKDEEVTTRPVAVVQVCENQGNVIYDKGGTLCGGNRVSGYSLSQTVIVRSGNVDTVTKLALEAPGTLNGAGLVFTSQDLAYAYSKLADIRLEMLDEATRNAKRRAERIASATGAALGRLTQASQGVFQVTAVDSTEVSDYGVYDTTALEKKVTAVVRATFGVE
jgi:hypothetical protein